MARYLDNYIPGAMFALHHSELRTFNLRTVHPLNNKADTADPYKNDFDPSLHLCANGM